jgi:hypothetical protein
MLFFFFFLRIKFEYTNEITFIKNLNINNIEIN